MTEEDAIKENLRKFLYQQVKKSHNYIKKIIYAEEIEDKIVIFTKTDLKEMINILKEV